MNYRTESEFFRYFDIFSSSVLIKIIKMHQINHIKYNKTEKNIINIEIFKKVQNSFRTHF